MNKYKSGFEYDFAKQLRKQRVKFGYETKKFPFTQPAKERTYTPDFELLGSGTFVECKGKLDVDTRYKLQWVKEVYPDLRLVLVFQKGRNKIRKGSATSYMDWAAKNGFEAYDWETDKKTIEKIKEENKKETTAL